MDYGQIMIKPKDAKENIFAPHKNITKLYFLIRHKIIFCLNGLDFLAQVKHFMHINGKNMELAIDQIKLINKMIIFPQQ